MIARDIKIDFLAGKAVIDWNGQATGLRLLDQKLVASVMTRLGSDKFNPERGNQLDIRLYQTGIYDAQTAQHELNFAAVAARRDVRAGRDDGIDDSTSEVKDLQIALRGVVNNRIQTALNVESLAGIKSGEVIII